MNVNPLDDGVADTLELVSTMAMFYSRKSRCLTHFVACSNAKAFDRSARGRGIWRPTPINNRHQGIIDFRSEEMKMSKTEYKKGTDNLAPSAER